MNPATPSASSGGRPSPWPSLPGTIGALVGLLAALTPSLLPRPPLFLGLIAGVGAAIGYGLGVLAAALARRLGAPEPADRTRRRLWWLLGVPVGILAVVAIVVAQSWQDEIRALLGVPAETGGSLFAAGTAVGTALVLVLLGRGLRRLTRRVTKAIGTAVPWPVAVLTAVTLVAVVGYSLVSDVVLSGFLAVADRVYSGANAGTSDGVEPPSSPLRSGGPGSLVSWDSLGAEGRNVVAGGATAAQIADFTGRPALEPIRVYAGVDSAPTAQDRAALVVAELRRTAAFDRDLLVVAGATGTGWLEPGSIDGVEYLWDGSTAIASSQYSYLPSWIAFLVDQERAAAEGRALFDAVHAAWSELPARQRPRLLVYGLSLGSFAIQAGFDGADDLARRTDGAILAGTPSFSEPWGEITADRDSGSPMWQPVVDGGALVRFAADSADLRQPDAPWGAPRTAYLQHGEDPVVWWNWDLLVSRPDWLVEDRAPTVSPQMRWFPVVTFLQVTVDQFFGVTMPNGRGHNYSLHMVDIWRAVAGTAPGWSAADVERLQDQLITGAP